MELTPSALTNATAVAAPGKAEEAKADQAKVDASADFQTFLTLLTAQLRNQDPLKPMESTEFVAQLASFSAVEQQVRANDRLEQIMQLLSGGAADGLAQWIGREVRAPASAGYSGVPIEVEVTPKTGAEQSVLVVRNDFGQVVARRMAAPTDTMVMWDGTTDLGQPAPHGRYSFALESYVEGAVFDSQPGRVFAPVTEVRLEDGAPVLILEGGARMPLDQITAVR